MDPSGDPDSSPGGRDRPARPAGPARRATSATPERRTREGTFIEQYRTGAPYPPQREAAVWFAGAGIALASYAGPTPW